MKSSEKYKYLLFPAIYDKLKEFSDNNEAQNGNAKGSLFSNLVLNNELKEFIETEKTIDIIPE